MRLAQELRLALELARLVQLELLGDRNELILGLGDHVAHVVLAALLVRLVAELELGQIGLVLVNVVEHRAQDLLELAHIVRTVLVQHLMKVVYELLT